MMSQSDINVYPIISGMNINKYLKWWLSVYFYEMQIVQLHIRCDKIKSNNEHE